MCIRTHGYILRVRARRDRFYARGGALGLLRGRDSEAKFSARITAHNSAERVVALKHAGV